MLIRFIQLSYHRLKAFAKSATFRVLAAPAHSFLKVSLVRMRPASQFNLGKRKKAAGVRSSE